MRKTHTLDGRRLDDLEDKGVKPGDWYDLNTNVRFKERRTSPATLAIRGRPDFVPPSAPSAPHGNNPHNISRRQKRVLRKVRRA